MASVSQLEEELNKLSALNKRSAKELDAFAAVSHSIAVRARRITKDIKPWEVAQENIALTIGEIAKAARCYYPPLALSAVLAGRNRNPDDVARCIDYLLYTEDYLTNHAPNVYGNTVLSSTHEQIQEIVVISENLVKSTFINSMIKSKKTLHSNRVFITNPDALTGIDKVILRLGENFNRLEVINNDLFLLLRNRLRERVELLFDVTYREEAENEDEVVPENINSNILSLTTGINGSSNNNKHTLYKEVDRVGGKSYGANGVLRPRQLAQSVIDNSTCSCVETVPCASSSRLSPYAATRTGFSRAHNAHRSTMYVNNTRTVLLQGTLLKHYRRGEHRLICISQQARVMLEETMACLEKYVYEPLDNNFAISSVAGMLVMQIFDIIIARALRAVYFDLSRLNNPTLLFLESGGQDIGLCVGKRYFRDIIFICLDFTAELWKWKGLANRLPGDPQACIDYVESKIDEYLFNARTLLEGYVDAKGGLDKHELKRYTCTFRKTEWMPSPDYSVHEMCTNTIYFHKELLTSYYGALKLALCGNVMELNANEEAVKEVEDFLARCVLGTLQDLETIAVAANEYHRENDIYGRKLIFRTDKTENYFDNDDHYNSNNTCTYHYRKKAKGQLSPEVFVLNNIAFLEQNYRKERCFRERAIPYDAKIAHAEQFLLSEVKENDVYNWESSDRHASNVVGKSNVNKAKDNEEDIKEQKDVIRETTDNNANNNTSNNNNNNNQNIERQTEKQQEEQQKQNDSTLADALALRNRPSVSYQNELKRRSRRKKVRMSMSLYILFLLNEEKRKYIYDFGKSWEECFPSLTKIPDLRDMKHDAHLPLRRKERNAFKKWHKVVTEQLEQKLTECQLLIVLNAPTRARLIQMASQSVHAQFATRDALLQSRE